MKKYPIYRISAKWHQPIAKPGPWDRTDGLPKGRCWNSASFLRMFKEELSENELNAFLAGWWEAYSKGHPDWSKSELAIEFVENETWCLGWFFHYTFDEGQSDDEALLSFASFVDRKMQLIRERGREAYCLMGAEDMWRWCGKHNEDGTSTPAPCRCDGCKEQGIIRIGH